VELLGTGYEYDFGDGWEHDLAVAASAVADAATSYPAGSPTSRTCSPGPEREEMRARAGEDYDPAHLDLAAANAAMALI
jgi:hypothetical protein